VSQSNVLRGRHRHVRWSLLVLGAVAVLGAAACGSSSGSSGASAGTSGTPTKSTINLMTIAAVNYDGPSYADTLETAKVWGEWTNAHGGIDGHPVQVTTCDDEGQPTLTASCGRKAIQDGDVALVGGFTLNGDALVPELAAASTAWFGGWGPASTAEYTNPVSLPMEGGAVLQMGMAIKAAADGCKHIVYTVIDDGAFATFAEQLVKQGLAAVHGPKLQATVLVPVTAQDYSAQAAQLVHGSDCILMGLGPSNIAALLPALQAAGATQRLYALQGNYTLQDLQKFPNLVAGSSQSGQYSDISLPVWSDYRAALKEFNAPTDLVYNTLGGTGTWAGFTGFEQIADQVLKSGQQLTNKTFLAAAQKATVNTGGMTGIVNFANKFKGLGGQFPQLVNFGVTYSEVDGTSYKSIDNGDFYDFTNAMAGGTLTAANIPPGNPR
jgi:branched-chain amino acid transport system substrate-binding protein